MSQEDCRTIALIPTIILQIILYPNSQILAEFQSVCAKSPGIGSGPVQGSLVFRFRGGFVCEKEKGVLGRIGGNVRGRISGEYLIAVVIVVIDVQHYNGSDSC